MVGENAMDERAPETTGAKLRRAREAAGLSLTDVAATTRIRASHLQALEEGDLGSLPGRTYAIGFARNFARAVGLDEAAIALSIRGDLAESGTASDSFATAAFTPGDPARVPSAKFAWIAAGAAVLFGAAGLAWWHGHDSTPASLPSLLPEAVSTPKPAKPAPPPTPVAASNTVVLTAEASGIWVKLYDASGLQLMQKQLVQGESITVPPEAKDPMLWTGSPEALAITVGGQAVPKLADSHKTIKDVRVSATALLARAAPAVAVGPGAASPAGLSAPQMASQPAAGAKLAVRAHKPKPKGNSGADDGAGAHLGGILPPPVDAAKPAEASAEGKPAPATP